MTVGRLGEREIIRRILSRAGPAPSPPFVVGPGADDAAVLDLPPGRRLVVTTDLLCEETHFRRDWTPPHLLGHKALAVNLSDLAAMGAEPLAFSLALALPADWPAADLEACLDGMLSLARRARIPISGGDTSSAARLAFAITALGTVEAGAELRRGGGRPGDVLHVSGPLGRSAAGLALLRRGWRMEREGTARAPAGGRHAPGILSAAAAMLTAHLAPEAELAQGTALARLATAGLDISDGLCHDVHNLCEASGCGALVEAERVPIDPGVVMLAAEGGYEPLDLALTGGEEYHLLVALPPGEPTPPGIPLHRVGVLEAAPGVRMRRSGSLETWPRKGYEHFTPDS